MSMTADCAKILEILREGKTSLPELLRRTGFDLNHVNFLLHQLEGHGRVQFAGELDYEYIDTGDAENDIPPGLITYDKWDDFMSVKNAALVEKISHKELETEKLKRKLEYDAEGVISDGWETETFQAIVKNLQRGFDVQFEKGYFNLKVEGIDLVVPFAHLRLVYREGEFFLSDGGVAIMRVGQTRVTEWEVLENIIARIASDYNAIRVGKELMVPIRDTNEAVAAAMKLFALIERVSRISVDSIIATSQDPEMEKSRWSLIFYQILMDEKLPTRKDAIAHVKYHLTDAYRNHAGKMMAMYIPTLKELYEMTDEDYAKKREETHVNAKPYSETN